MNVGFSTYSVRVVQSNRKKLIFLQQNYRMACEFILKSGKNKGKQCRLKGSKAFNRKLFCARHHKVQEMDAMRKEDVNLCERIGNSFDIIREIGKGAFGRVLLVQDIATEKRYAMKVAKAKKEADLLFYEYTLLCHHLNNNASFPALLPVISQSYQRTTKGTYLVLEYFEETLKQRSLREELSEQQIKSYGLQILDIIEYIHRKRYLYIDIKPENFMFKSRGDEDIKIIDFGLCQKYVSYKGKHIPSKTLSNPIGTDLYSSIRMMKCEQPGRIDDIECIGYLMLELHSGLPWSNVSFDEILSKKSDTATFLEAPVYIQELIALTRACSYDKEPNYGQFRKILR